MFEFFLIKLQAFRAAALSKTDSVTGVFLSNLNIFKNIFVYRTPPVAASEKY